MELKVGEKYQCKIIRLIEVPFDGEFYIIEDPVKNKHLLKAEYFKDYHFKINEIRYFYVDKINCQGRIYFEPEHPVFKLNKKYLFKIVNHIDSELPDNKSKAFTVKHKSGYKCTVFKDKLVKKNIKIGDLIELKVIRIKKSHPILTQK